MKYVVFFVLVFVVNTQNILNAQKETFVREYTYQASESDSKLTARTAATTEMRNMLLKEIGEFIYAETNMNTKQTSTNGKDEFSKEFTEKVKAITSGFVEMKVLQETWNGVTYYIKAEMTVDPSTVGQKVTEALKAEDKNTQLPTQSRETLMSDIEIVNLGDGKYFVRTRQGQQALNGEYKIIDGVHSAYVQMSFKEGLYDGKYQLFVNTRIKEEGFYIDGFKEKLFKEYFSDGTTLKSETPYTRGKINGLVRAYFNNGKIEQEKGYKDGIEHGIEKRYNFDTGACETSCQYQNGKLQGEEVRQMTGTNNYSETKNYEKGILHGAYSCTFLNGKPYKKGAYIEGKKTGQWIQFRDNGDTVSVETYTKGLRNGPEISFGYGKRSVYTTYVNNKKDGIEQRWTWSSKSFVEITNFKEGRKNGQFKSFYLVDNSTNLKNATLKQTGQYENDRRVGHWASYDINGNVKEEWDE
jgi:antitoxin component YwqK of YwqJK toxin-antitoxin module